MRRVVLAALDTSMAAHPVLVAALALGEALAADVEAVHVRADGSRVPRDAAAAERVPLRVAQGPVVEALAEAAQTDDVLALVVGTHRSPLRREPLGKTALAVARSLSKPILVVPPDAPKPAQLRRVLVPLQWREWHAPGTIIALAKGTALDLVVLHVLDEESLPLFTDQPQHEQPAQVHEFLRRYCPWGIDSIDFEVRVGRPDELVPVVAEEIDADVIALGWAQELAPGRAPVVRAALKRARVPVLLIPVQAVVERDVEPLKTEASSSSVQSSRA